MEIGKLGLPLTSDPSLYQPSEWHGRYWNIYQHALNNTEIGNKILSQLQSDGRVTSLSGKMITRGVAAEIFDIKKLGMWFVWRANQLGIEIAEKELEEFLNSEYVETINTLWITGLSTDSKIDVVDGFHILPAIKMPETQDRAAFIGYGTFYLTAHDTKPMAAIVKRQMVHKTLSEQPSESGKHLIDELMATSRELHDVALVLNCCRDIFCLPYYSTSYPPDSVPYGPFGAAGGGKGSYDVMAHGTVQAGAGAGPEIARVFTAFRHTSPRQQARFRLILDRLSQAKRRNKLEDKILDLGITLEMLLLSDNTYKDQLSQSFRLRGAWLIGDTAERRSYLFGLLKELYSFRCDVAHGGMLSEKSRTQASEKYPLYQQVAEDICQKIICGGEPEWEKLLLGAI